MIEKWEREYNMKSESMNQIIEKRRRGKENEKDEFDNWAMEYLFYNELIKRIKELKEEKRKIEEYYKRKNE